ncbi:Threonylcarbamoyl-AMP synthase / SUA5 domain with internal deletion [hydrothermal vent metagenome]|uniref:Threonylcarbamoyl-AMP synthase n=1 Tax=hydrothermal vent metagenome TaxID=652676 RepID=A0A3B1AHV7_9ZZZZ
MLPNDKKTTYEKIIPAVPANLNLASKYLLQGKLVSFPTETVYGLGADATNDQAVARIFAAKKRPNFNPLIIHLPSLAEAEKYVEFDMVSRKMAEAFWPGPFTLVLKKKPGSILSPLVSAGLDTVAVRVPEHPVITGLLQLFKYPIAAPSANISGKLSPTRPEHVAETLSAKLAMILEGPPCRNGIESTIAQVVGSEIRLLRPGSITKEKIEKLTGLRVTYYEDGENPTAPGQLKSHYAPNKKIRLNALTLYPGEALLAFGSRYPKDVQTLKNLSPKGSLLEAASNLFSMLHELDNTDCTGIAVSPIPNKAIGIAINDRLTRAAAMPEKNPETNNDF